MKAALAGVQAGVLGGLVMLAALSVAALLEHDAWWSYPNLIGATFYGTRALRSGAGWPTVAGISFQLVIAGCAGALFALTFGRTKAPLRAVLGVAWGALLFYLSRKMYQEIAPLVALYAPDTSMLLGHMLLGAFLGRVRSAQTSAARAQEPRPDTAADRADCSAVVGATPAVDDVAGTQGPSGSAG
jgi:hypothetical protein